MSRSPKVFTIPPGVPFVDALAAQVLSEHTNHQFDLPRVHVLLPNRRACRALTLAFMRLSGAQALLLPKMTALGDIDEDEIVREYGEGLTEPHDFEVPPAIPPIRRQLLLARLILALRGTVTLPDHAARLAQELARLLDQVQTERCDWRRLYNLVPDEFADHWQITLDFLKIITQHWPRILSEERCIDPADRRNRLLAAQCRAWSEDPPVTPVIAAGSTGSIPASADLLRVISTLPAGAVVLPGLDTEADAATWEVIKGEPWHPQFGMAHLLDHLAVERSDVKQWPCPPSRDPSSQRASLVNRALYPAACSSPWEPSLVVTRALENLTRIDAPGPEEEARVIALLMRETLEHPAKSAVLVTPDRTLARRVAAELRRWDVAVDDSAGVPLAETPPGVFMRLVARMVTEDFAPVPLLATLKHPLCSGGMAPGRFRAAVRRLELALLRGPRLRSGLPSLHSAAKRSEVGDATVVVERVMEAAATLSEVLERGSLKLDRLVSAHLQTAERLATSDCETGAERLWRKDAGEALADFMRDLIEAADDIEFVGMAGYPAFFDTLLAGQVVRPAWGRHLRLAIWGPLEARLQHADVMILGGLNEETWPPRIDASPWMSRPMMKAFGLSLPERRLGLSAHDFCQAFCAPNVWITRARRKEGSPTVPSRWLLRLDALIRRLPAVSMPRGEQWMAWQAMLDQPQQEARRIKAPCPRPPVAARPRRLSVTRIEKWMRDPYSIYAECILDLRALPALDAELGVADYGSFVHQALDLFLKRECRAGREEAITQLLTCGRMAFAPVLDRAEVRAFWWPRFERISAWFAAIEEARRSEVLVSSSEVKGRLVLRAPAGDFELNAKADRIDVLADGQLAIIDYKTGAIPKTKEVMWGFAPQLPLEAAIAVEGGFAGIPAAPVAAIEFWRLRGNGAGGQRQVIGKDPLTLATEAIAGLSLLIETFDREETGYEARPRASVSPRYSDYEHLARVKEWSASGQSPE